MNIKVIGIGLGIAGALAMACASPPPESEDVASTQSRQTGPLSAYVYNLGGIGLNVRAEPNVNSQVIGSLPEGATIMIECQKQTDNGIWDKLSSNGGGWVSDRFVYTGYDGFAPGAAKCGSSDTTKGPPPSGGGSGGSGSSLGATIVANAKKWVGTHADASNCQPFSSSFNRPCEAWCSDFVDYVWRESGANIDGITAYSGTIYRYGINQGTMKSGAYANNVVPGDAVLWGTGEGDSRHVGIVSAVNADGSLEIINGNFYMPDSQVHKGTYARSTDVGTGAGIYAFVSPVAR